MTERASSVALDVDQLLMAWRRFTWLLSRCTTPVYWQMELLLHRIINSLLVDLVQPIRLVHSGYSAILLEPFDMAWGLLNIVLYCDLPFSLSHINTCTDTHTHTHFKSHPNLQPELVRRERGLGIWAKGLCSPYWFVTQQVELSFHGVFNMYLTRIITKCELLDIILQLQNEPTCLWNCLFVFGGNICSVSSIWQVSM